MPVYIRHAGRLRTSQKIGSVKLWRQEERRVILWQSSFYGTSGTDETRLFLGGEQKTAQALLAEIKDMTQQWSMAGCKALKPLMVVHVVSE